MIEEKIKDDLKQALKEKDNLKIAVLRFLLAEIHNFWIEKQRELKDEEIISVIRRQIKLRKEAISFYQKANRNDLADKENKEIAILSKYLPQELSPEELEEVIKKTIREVGAGSAADFGKVMGVVMGKIKGAASGEIVASLVKKNLAVQ